MPMFTASRLQVATYLLGVCPFSIAFLVFLNSSVSFIITDLIGDQDGVGDAVGNLGFADELVALVACPVWGLLSDRIGVRTVCCVGYAIIALALLLFVQAKNVYPQLLLGRLFFSIGAAAASTMVTAVLPAMSFIQEPESSARKSSSTNFSSHAQSPSIASELTITPDRFRTASQVPGNAKPNTETSSQRSASTSRTAGFVGMFTGLGALIALLVFLPLPTSFQKHGIEPGPALQYSYYIVAVIAALLSIICIIGLRNLKSEVGKGWSYLLRDRTDVDARIDIRHAALNTWYSLRQAVLAGFQRSDIGIGYIGGFVARASSVGISLFIPLLVNALFTSSGLCVPHTLADTPASLPDIKRRCPRAYIVAAELTGASQTIALITAPLFGYWSARTSRKSLPLATAAVAGIIGYPLLAVQFDPNDENKRGRVIAFVAVCLIGYSQIGAIVCSLASIGTGVLTVSASPSNETSTNNLVDRETTDDHERQPLVTEQKHETRLSDLKGSVAGVYSFFGGAAILILTKAGGAMFDNVSTGAPFYIMASFNAIMLIAIVTFGLSQARHIAG